MAKIEILTKRIILDAMRLGEAAELGGKEVAAAFLREQLLATSSKGPGLRLKGAKILGDLDLSDCTGLPALLLEECRFTGDINADNAEIARLSLKKCRINGVRLRGTRLGGVFDFSGVTTAGDSAEAPAWIDGNGCKISGGVYGWSAKLRYNPELSKLHRGNFNYALSLSDAVINGSVRLTNGFEASGGVNISSTHIAGDFFANGSIIVAGGDNAFTAQASKIDGNVLLKMNATGGVWLLGAKIGGTLDCAGAHFMNRTENGAGAALVVENIEVGGDVNLRNDFTAEGCISFSGAKIGGGLACDGAHIMNRTEDGTGDALIAENIEVGGVVSLRNDFTAEGRVSLSGAKIGGNLDCAGAHFMNRTENGACAALVAENIEVGGGVYFRNDFTAEGCVSLRGAKIGSDLECDGAHIMNRTEDGTGDALTGQNIEVGGGVYLRDGFTAEGRVSFGGAKIGGSLECDGAHFVNRVEDGSGDALIAEGIEIEGSVCLRNEFKAEGRVSLIGAKIGRGLECDGAHFMNRTEDGARAALVAENIEVGGGVYLRDDFTAEGRVSLIGAKIGGSLECDGAHFMNRVEDGSGNALYVENVEIVGSALLRGGFTAEGRVSLLGAKIGGALDCTAARLYNHGSMNAADAFDASTATIGRDVLMNGLVCIGRVSFGGAKIGGGLNCTGAKFVALPPENRAPQPWENALGATNATIDGDVTLENVEAIGHLVFEHAKIGSGFCWDGLNFPNEITLDIPTLKDREKTANHMRWSYRGLLKEGEDITVASGESTSEPQAQLVLAHAEIGAALKAYRLSAAVKLLVNLSAAKAFTLDDDQSEGGKKIFAASFPAGWGGTNENVPLLDLDGFVYQRIEHFPVNASAGLFGRFWLRIGKILQRMGQSIVKRLPQRLQHWLEQTVNARTKTLFGALRGERNIALPRLEWVARQNLQGKTDFYPQPYRHLATVLRSQGHMAAARQVAIAEANKSSRGALGILLRCFWGFCFGYGLAPGKATLALGLTLALGWFLVDETYRAGAMELTANEISAVAAVLDPGKPIPSDLKACEPGKAEIEPILYDIDMALPIVPLHQEDKCEVRQGYWIRIIAFAVFSMFGKLVTTLTLLTWSGVMKPKDE